jgi:hypothetical protein
MRVLDELHLEHPVYGSRRLRALLEHRGFACSRSDGYARISSLPD